MMQSDTRSWLQRQFKGLLLVVTASIILAAGFNTFRSDGIPWFEDWNARMRSRTLPEGISGISSEEARNLFQSGTALFLDARDPEGFVEGHIRGALNLPINQFGTAFPNLADRLSQAALIVTYCSDVTCDMSDELAQSLLLNGYSNVMVYLGGVREWEEMGQPLETGSVD
ncbi:MAG: rhodanese-like domain-containing protein [Deltaproteobacteria bacterium]|nr:rhodanese-like domain-containing protein [Deltaproteobacteria bacterium]